MSTTAAQQLPKLWKYLLGALIALIILIPAWAIFVMLVVQPESLMTSEQTMVNRTIWWIAGPVIVVSLFFSARWMTALNQMEVKKQQVEVQQTVATEQSKREYVLEVIGLGVTLDKYRQGKLWEALQKGNPYVTIREQDEEKYPYTAIDKDGISGGRGGDSLENGAQYTPMYYGVPVFNAEPPVFNSRMIDTPQNPMMGLAGGAVSSGMAWHLFVNGSRRFSEHPDHILEDVFAFFDANPDVPYVVLNSDDSMASRNIYSPEGSPFLLKDGNYIPEMPDASTLFVLARRERVDAVRPFVWDDPDNDFVQNKLRWMYGDVMQTVTHRGRVATRTPAQVGADMSRQETNEGIARPPLVSEWLEAAAAFAQRPDVRGTGHISLLDKLNPWAHRPPKDWKATPWFPIPWNRDQLATFDKLPTLGFIHRPTFVQFVDANGKPLTRRDERQKALQAGWQSALQNLPEAQRGKGPARVIAASGNNVDLMVALHNTLSAYAEQGGPEIDSSKSEQFINTDRRLGNTGATTLFMQMALGVMGSYRDGGVSTAINLRDKNEASIVFISPPSDAQRKHQKHPRGGDVFDHHGSPAINPADYE